MMAPPAFESSDWGLQTVPAHHAPGARTQSGELQPGHPSAAVEEAHPFTQQVFLILRQMGNSFHGILMYETRMFPVTSYIPLFIPSVNNYLLSSLDVLMGPHAFITGSLLSPTGCSQPGTREGDHAV